MTDSTPGSVARNAILLHVEDAPRRRAWRVALQPLDCRLLLSGRAAEAAKCLIDPELVLVVAVDRPDIRAAMQALRPELPVCWIDASDAADDVAQRDVRNAAVERLSRR